MYPSVSSDTAYKIIDKEGDRRYELANPLASVFFNTTNIKLMHRTAFIGFQTDATDFKPMNGFF